jgi:hypothetical protein
MHRVQASQDLYGRPDRPPLNASVDVAWQTATAGNGHYSPPPMHRVRASQDLYGQPESPPLGASDEDAGSLLWLSKVIPVLKARHHHRLPHCRRTNRPITVRFPKDTISGRGEPSCTGRVRIARSA